MAASSSGLYLLACCSCGFIILCCMSSVLSSDSLTFSYCGLPMIGGAKPNCLVAQEIHVIEP